MEGGRLVAAASDLGLEISGKLKQRFQRPRPFRAHPDLPLHPGSDPPGASFVSGHASYSSSAATLLGWIAPHLRAQLDELASQVAYSRVYLAAHYPTDVVGGAYVGGAAAAFTAARS